MASRRVATLVIVVSLIALFALSLYFVGGYKVIAISVAGALTAIFKYLLWPLIIEVSGSRLSEQTPRNLSDLRPFMQRMLIGSWRINRHLEDQADAIERMPFLLKEVVGIENLLDNFIEIKAASLDLKSFHPRPTPSVSIKNYVNTLKDSKKIVLLGGAGVGKTTFQRHTTLKLIKDRANVPYVEPNENFVPFYIQLRLIKSGVPYPIRTHLLTQPYFAGTQGPNRLLKLASEGRLFLFLDGYDETAFSLAQREKDLAHLKTRVAKDKKTPDTSQTAYGRAVIPYDTHLKDELKLIMSPNMSRIATRFEQSRADIEFYRGLQGCRVWLSSRKDFFRNQNPFAEHELPISGYAIVEIEGVDSRQKLIEKVFSKYRLIRENPTLFKADLFFNLINRDVGELESLSNNPLLLIIICKIYAHEVVKSGNPRAKIANRLDAIIERYFDLLLVELDEDKNEQSDLHIGDREWLKEGRGLYVDEKRQFLKFFAAQLYLQNKDSFSKEYVYESVGKFFTEASTSEQRLEILDGVKNRPAPTDFVGQIFNSNIFIDVEESRKVLHHDFPHQRFRELLAAQYFDDWGHDYLLEHLEEVSLNGLFDVFFRITKHRDAVVAIILEQIADAPKQADTPLRILKNCLEQNAQYSPRLAFSTFLTKRLEFDLPFEIPEELRSGLEDRSYFEPNDQFTQQLARHLSTTSRVGNNCIRLSADLLWIYEKKLLRYVLEEYFEKHIGKWEDKAFYFRAELLYRCDREVIKGCFARLFHRYLRTLDSHNLQLCCSFMRSHDFSFLKELFRNLLAASLQSATARRDFTQHPPPIFLLHAVAKNTLNEIIAETIEEHLKENHRSSIPMWLLEMFEPTLNFQTVWALALGESVASDRPYALLLAIELGFRFERLDLENKSQQELMPALKAGNATLLQLVILIPRINEYLKELGHDDAKAKEILKLASICRRLIPRGLPPTQDGSATPRFCHIITHDILRKVQDPVSIQGESIDKKAWINIYKLSYQVFLKEVLLQRIPPSFPKSVVEALLTLSRVSYSSYRAVSESCDKLDLSFDWRR